MDLSSTSKRQLQEPHSGSDGSRSKRGKQSDYEMADNNGAQSHSNSVTFTGVESVETHFNNSNDFAEVVIDLNITPSPKKNDKSVNTVLSTALALKNSCGGVIRLNIKEGTQHNFDKWATTYSSKEKELRRTLGENDAAPSSCLPKGKNHDNIRYIFIKKTAHVLTEKANILKRLEESNETVNRWEQINSMLKRRTVNRCICTNSDEGREFYRCNEVLPEGETRHTEYKYFPGDNFCASNDVVAKKVADNASSFANTYGGTLYIGVSDDRKVLGQHIAADKKSEMQEFLKAILKGMIWLPFTSKEPISPEVNVHYRVNFIPVDGATDRMIIAIHICTFDGTVFVDKPKCPTIDDKNQVTNMEFDDWLLSFRNSDASNEKYQIKDFGKTVYKQLKGTIIKDTFKDLPGQIKVHPKNAAEWIHNDTFKLFIDFVNKTFKESGGHAFVQKSWYTMLGKPLDKPDNAICDILLCRLGCPLVLITLTDVHHNKNDVHHYNRILAAKIKRELAQEAGCLEEFFVIPLVLCEKDISLPSEVMFPPDPRYPPQYSDMPGNKYTTISEALALVIARVNSSVTYEAQQKHFNVLTEEQYSILADYYGTSWVHIMGLPGTGKTFLALERIYRLRLEGCRRDEILFVCSNKPLTAKVQNIQMQHDGKPLCLVCNYFHCLKTKNFHSFNITHIVVDEVHNFKNCPSNAPYNWWNRFLDNCNSDDSTIWFFSDRSQKITKEETVKISAGVPTKVLKTVIRTTGQIFEFCNRFVQLTRGAALGHDIQGAKPQILIPSEKPIKVSCKQHLVNILLDVLYRLIVREGHSQSSISVLFDNDTERVDYWKMFKIRAPACHLRSGDEVKKRGIIFDTIRRYAGVENSVIIGFCPRFYQTPRFQDNMALMTALCSRAELELILVFDSISTAKLFGLEKKELQEVHPTDKKIWKFPSTM